MMIGLDDWVRGYWIRKLLVFLYYLYKYIFILFKNLKKNR